MVAVAIFSADPVLRRNFEQLPRDDPALVIVGMVDQPSSVRVLVNRNLIDVLMVDAPTRELLAEYRAGRDRMALVILLAGVYAEDPACMISAGVRYDLDSAASSNK